MPHVTGLQESDSVHVVSGNVNVLGYVADTLGLYRTVGPAGYRGSVGASFVQSGFEFPTVGILLGIFVVALSQIFNREIIIEEKAFST